MTTVDTVVSALFFVIPLAITYYLYRSGQTTAIVAPEHQVTTEPGALTAIEYYWRPG